MRAALIFVAVLLAAVVGKIIFAFAFPAPMMSVAGVVPTIPLSTQLITSLALSGGTFAPGSAAGTAVGTASATMTPATPRFNGTWSLSSAGGGDTTDFTINSATGQITTVTPSLCGSPPCSYQITEVATQHNISNSPFSTTFTVTASSGPSIPVAANAGCTQYGTSNGSCFNTLAMNMDFRTSSAVSGFNGKTLFNAQSIGNGSSGWLGCSATGSPNSTAWTNFFGGFTANATCPSSWSIVSDTDGGTVSALKMTYTTIGNGNAGAIADEAGMGTNSNVIGFPQQFYVEFRWRTDAATNSACGNHGSAFSECTDIWSYNVGGHATAEYDFIEVAFNGYGSGTTLFGTSCCYINNPTWFSAGSGTVLAYHTYGERVTENSNTVMACWYLDGSQVNIGAGNAGNCQTEDSSAYTTNMASPIQMIIQAANMNDGQTAGLTGTAYFEYEQVWTCSNWTQAWPPTGNGAACQGGLVSSNP